VSPDKRAGASSHVVFGTGGKHSSTGKHASKPQERRTGFSFPPSRGLGRGPRAGAMDIAFLRPPRRGVAERSRKRSFIPKTSGSQATTTCIGPRGRSQGVYKGRTHPKGHRRVARWRATSDFLELRVVDFASETLHKKARQGDTGRAARC